MRALVLTCYLLAFCACSTPGVPIADVDISAALGAVQRQSSLAPVHRDQQIGVTADRQRGRQHDTYVVRLATGDTTTVRQLAEAGTSALEAAGWRAGDRGAASAGENGKTTSANAWAILKRVERDGSIHVIWNGQQEPAVFTVLVDLGGTRAAGR